jgi:DNA-binding transcriptional MerR regulator
VEDPGSRPEDLLRTAEVLERTGITHQILYRYITLGLIEPSMVKASGLRLFHRDVVALIESIKNLNQRYSLRDIKEIYFRDERVRRHTERTRAPE